MATYNKPRPRYSMSDWYTLNYTIARNAELQRNDSCDTRQEAWHLHNETLNKTIWNQHDNNMHLSDRIDSLCEWKIILEKTDNRLMEEISCLVKSKNDLENSLEAKNINTDVNIENLVSRDGRMGANIIYDDVADQLHKV